MRKESKMNTNRNNKKWWLLLLSVCLCLTTANGCDDGDEKSETSENDTGAGAEESFECEEGRGGWEQCLDNKVQYCHIVEGMDPHFHWGADCESLGYECIELSESEAVCLDESTDCEPGEFRCEENTVYNCVAHGDYGHFAVEPCGTAATCHEHDDEAHCEQGESDFEPQDACDAITGDEVEAKAVVTVFSDVFSEDYHADLGVKVSVTLPDNETSYIHFPVFTCGEYAVFLDQTEVFDGVQRRDETEMLTSGGTAVGLCEEDIPEHWHAELEWDGEGTEEDSPVPYVIRFKAVEGGGSVHFAVFQIAGEE
jgi:hypothetical protein